jgi:hypothetical protein
MANAVVYGFRPIKDENYKAPSAWPVAASQTIAVGDPVSMDTAGRVIIAVANSSTIFLGVAASASASAAVGSTIYVWDDPNQQFEAMVSTGALTDAYTTRSAAAAFDLAGTTGAFYVNAAASTQNVFKCVGLAKDPVTGEDSAVGSNQMKHWIFNSGVHIFGTIA